MADIKNNKRTAKGAGFGAWSAVMEKAQKIDFLHFIVGVIILGQAFAFYQLMSLYIQDVKTTHQEYERVVSQFNDERYKILENRVQSLENRIASQSAK